MPLCCHANSIQDNQLDLPGIRLSYDIDIVGAIHGQSCMVLFAKIYNLSEIKAALLEILYVNADETYPSSNWSGRPPQGIRLLAASGPPISVPRYSDREGVLTGV
ncbi:hypothetical protein EMCG_07954 [[Emmonsia] crescens]|uniref:Uncharacterized protein n=1 Tax=[Emmonsia] crescens TaxID=73230 RepID=A0A0G2I786_9EURO|nr:hypothetical protein EMCG_07954 [Emmonsia crescens UAMH 3008]